MWRGDPGVQCKSSSLYSRWDHWRHINSYEQQQFTAAACCLSYLSDTQTEINSFCFHFQLMYVSFFARSPRLCTFFSVFGFVFARLNLGQLKLKAELGFLHFNFIFGRSAALLR